MNVSKIRPFNQIESMNLKITTSVNQSIHYDHINFCVEWPWTLMVINTAWPWGSLEMVPNGRKLESLCSHSNTCILIWANFGPKKSNEPQSFDINNRSQSNLKAAFHSNCAYCFSWLPCSHIVTTSQSIRILFDRLKEEGRIFWAV